MKTFLKCVREAWWYSHPKRKSFFDHMAREEVAHQFHDLAASVIEQEDIKTDLEDVLLKTPSDRDKLETFVFEGRIE